jgi:chromosome segregation ATPase
LRTARGEIDRVQRQISTIEQRRDALRAQVADVEAELESHLRRKQLLEELVFVEQAEPVTDAADRTRARPVRRAIKGAELRRAAGRQLWDAQGEQEVHYREWFERLIAAGYAIGGKDPLASFLTNIRDSPAVARGSRQGYYKLDPDSAAPLEQQLSEVQAELADVERSIDLAYANVEPSARIEALREHRSHLRQTAKRLEAKLDEVRYVFQGGRDGDDRQDRDAADTAGALRAA